MTRDLWLYLLDTVLLGVNDTGRRLAVLMLMVHLLAACYQTGPYAVDVLDIPPLPTLENPLTRGMR